MGELYWGLGESGLLTCCVTLGNPFTSLGFVLSPRKEERMAFSSIERLRELGWPTSSQIVHFSNNTGRLLLGEGKKRKKEKEMMPNIKNLPWLPIAHGNGPNSQAWHARFCETCTVLLFFVLLWGLGPRTPGSGPVLLLPLCVTLDRAISRSQFPHL